MFVATLRQYWILVLVLVIPLVKINQAQESNDFFFQKLTTVNGLSSNNIQCLFHDSRGYVWIGTNDGLNRYDGRNIKIYHHDANNPRSIPRDDIRIITEDQNGIIWLGADYGLIELNPLTEQFSYYRHDANNPGSLGQDHLPGPFIDAKNNLWLYTEKGLQLFNRRSRTFKTFQILHADPPNDNYTPEIIWPAFEDKNNNIWGVGGDGAIHRFNPSKSELKIFSPQNISDNRIVALLIDHDANFWALRGNSGLHLFHPENGRFEPVPTINFDRYVGCQKICEWKDPLGSYWLIISTDKGLVFYNHKSRKYILVRSDPLNPYSLIENGISYLYTDQENIVWIGASKGLNILNNADQLFHVKTISQGSSFGYKAGDGHIETIYEDPDLKMVSFWWTRGLVIYTKEWKAMQFYLSIPPQDTSLEARDIYGVFRDFRGFYWMATDNNLLRFDRKTNLFKVYNPTDDKGIPPEKPKLLREIIQFDSTSFYVKSKTFGIYKFDFVNEEFVQHLTHSDNDPKSLPSNNLRALLKDNQDRLIIVSVNEGIFIYDPRKNTFATYKHDPDASVDEAIHNLYYDPGISKNTLWLNSAHGLLKFDLATNKFELFNSRNGLSNDFLVSNEVDNNGNVWVAHNAGISKFNLVNRTFTNYSINNGLVFREFGHNMRTMADSNIYIGDEERLISFNPDQFSPNPTIPQVHINSVQVENEAYNITIDSITRNKILTLDYTQDLITVDFSVLNFSHPKENRFFYRLDEDTVWHKLNEGLVTLVRMSPGQYVLHVTGSNDSGVMNEKGDSLYIRISPPYYQAWWFRVLILFGIALIVFVIQRIWIKRIRYEEHLKTGFNKQLAHAETKALRAQMNPHFIFNCLNSINSFVIDQKYEVASDYLIKFSKLIRLILDNSRSETISIEKELETLKLYILLESARYENKFKCVYQIAENVNTNSIMIPPMLLQPYVENAIWHGLMQKEGEGTITIEIKKKSEETLHISIMDDGIGREKAAQLKSKSATHKSHGLKVTALRIEMMNKLNSTGAHVDIIDLKDEQGHATGTKVELIIPF
jgi:ligand-binding sensor domain-containing protein